MYGFLLQEGRGVKKVEKSRYVICGRPLKKCKIKIIYLTINYWNGALTQLNIYTNEKLRHFECTAPNYTWIWKVLAVSQKSIIICKILVIFRNFQISKLAKIIKVVPAVIMEFWAFEKPCWTTEKLKSPKIQYFAINNQ